MAEHDAVVGDMNSEESEAQCPVAHWCTLVVSVVEELPMHLWCRRVIALLA